MKTRKQVFQFHNSNNTFKADIPLECPHCGAYVMPTVISKTYTSHSGKCYHLFLVRNNCCDNISQLVYESYNDKGELLALLPHYVKTADLSTSIREISPRFVKLYNQCYEAEQKGHYELAGSGYRNAVEVLIKDFAINVLGEPEKDVKSKSLAKAIEDHLPNLRLSKAADVIRVLGNDHTHYERKYEDIDFHVLKQYMQIFIDSIDCEYLIRNPVVKTNPNLSQE